jgi:hypothetical protein
MTSACLHQPNAFPWVKLVDKVLASDVWVVYDTAQYTRTEFHSRQLIKGRQGPVWLSVPVTTAGRSARQPLVDVEICDRTDWRAAHLRLLREHYLRAPCYDQLCALVEPVYRRDHRYLVDFTLDLTTAVVRFLGGRTEIVRASALPHDGDRTQRLIDLTRAVGADVHVTSSYHHAAIDLDWSRVADAGITVCEQQFTHPVYPQRHGPFVPRLSVLDLLANCGADSVRYLPRRPCTTVVPATRESAGGTVRAGRADPVPSTG